MTNEEFEKLCEEFRAQGLEDKDILNVVFQMYLDEKIDKDELEKLAGALGYELSEEFKTETEDEGVTAEDIEDAKEYEGPEAEEETGEEDDSEESEDEKDEDWRKNFGL